MADLISIGPVKTFIGLGDNCDDAQLKRLIGYVCDAVETYLGRTLALTEYREWVDGSDSAYQRLNNWPITALYQVASGSQNLGRLTYSGTSPEAFASSDGTTLRLIDASVNEITLASYPTGDDLVTAVAAITGWTLTLYTAELGGYDTRKLRPFSDYANDQNSIDLEIPEGTIYGARVSENQDWLIEGGFPGGMSNIFLWYKAGYSTLPEGLEWAMLQIIRDAYYSSKANRDLTKGEEKLGDYSYKNSTGGDTTAGGYSLADIVGSYGQQLSPYKRVEFA